MLDNYNIILGSASPRRKELLTGLDLQFEVRKIDVVESYPDNLKAEQIPLYLAEQKASAFTLKPNDLLITADTIVWLNDKVYGKPRDVNHAIEMLHDLSGRTHQVYTGVCISTVERRLSFTSCTDVTFNNLSDEEIHYYVNKYKPLDKAGSYGVQEWIGYIGVKHINGSYYNVMGLPVQKLYRELLAF